MYNYHCQVFTQLLQIPTPSALSGTCAYPNQAASRATEVPLLWPRVVGVIEAPHSLLILAKPFLAEHNIVEIIIIIHDIVCV